MEPIEVAVPTPLSQTFTYLAPAALDPGTRVVVPFGRRQVVGVALGPGVDSGEYKLKSVASVVDQSPIYSDAMLAVARWMSRYYMHPLGEVLRTMLPASVSQTVKAAWQLSDAGEALRDEAKEKAASQLSADHLGPMLLELFPRKTNLSETRLQQNWQAKVKGTLWQEQLPAIEQLAKLGLATRDVQKSIKTRASAEGEAAALAGEAEQPPELTPQQTEVFAALKQALTEREQADAVVKPQLLHGITGSGKTEIYLRVIAAVQESGDGQCLVLVPEISLTPQMTQVFQRRFPGQVAVVHSAMADHERWQELDRIRRGQARILIGPRSAVFGPFNNLAAIMVDEEHDSSYKQTTGLTYNGRDIAVLRGHLEKALVILGSATPSMESWANAKSGKYQLLTLNERASGRPLPDIHIIPADMKANRATKIDRGGVGISPASTGDLVADESTQEPVPIDDRVIKALQENMAAGRQAMVLVNRRGYAYYLFSLHTKEAVPCPSCSISMTLHARSTLLRCHYCDYKVTVDEVLAKHPEEQFMAVGFGSQKAEDALAARLPDARIVRVDSDTVAKKNMLATTLDKFRRGEIDVLVGTQILAKGHDFPNVTLICVLEVDQLLGLPDFRAGERTFQLVVQAAGRAGRAEHPGRVLIQSLRPQHPVIQAAIEQDFHAFANREIDFRRAHGYPPFARMICFEFSDSDRHRLSAFCMKIEAWLEKDYKQQPQQWQEISLLGPATPVIETIRRRHRRTVLLTSNQPDSLRAVAARMQHAFAKLPRDMRLKVDVDPQSLI